MVEEKNTYSEEYGDRIEKMMGSFSARMLHIENLMGDIMSRHFCSSDGKKSTLFFSLITPQMSFRNRINILMNMLKIHYKDIYKTYDPDLRKLHEIDQYRNDLVHLMLAVSEQVHKKDVNSTQIHKSENGKSAIREISKEEHESKVRLCTKLTTILKIIQRDIIGRGYRTELSDDSP
jgi:hypothetical protein